jgi:hypothetical protein
LKLIRPLDIVIIFILVFVSIGFIIFSQTESGKKQYYLHIDNKKIKLNGNEGVIDLKKYDKSVVIELIDGKGRFVESNCQDKICIKTGFIDKCGDIAVCLPNKVALEIKCEVSEFDAISR